MDSYPPQCGGPGVIRWDWDDVDGEESASGTTWGTYAVVGTWDGAQLTLTEPPGPTTPIENEGIDLSTPCPPPAGGWAVVDPAKVSSPDEVLQYARAQADFAGAWLDQSVNPASHEEPIDASAMNDPTQLVLNVRFTGDLPRHEAAIREVWGGALCLTEADRKLEELEAVQREVHEELDPLYSDLDETSGTVILRLIVEEPGLRASLDDRYGAGTVRVSAALRPVP